MPVILRNTTDFSCVADVNCNTKIMPVQINDRIEMQRYIASLGQVVAEGHNGMRQGNLIPFNGFSVYETSQGFGSNGTMGNIFLPVYETSQLFEITKMFSHFTLQAEGKLFLGRHQYGTFGQSNYITYFTSIEVVLRETQTGYEQRLMRLVPNINTPGGGQTANTNPQPYFAAPGEITAPFETQKRVRIVGALNPQFIAPVGFGVGVELITRITQPGIPPYVPPSPTNPDGTRTGINLKRSDPTGAGYWSGLLYYQLKLHHSCQ